MRRRFTAGGLVSLVGAFGLSAVLGAAGPPAVAEAVMQGNHDVVRTLLKQGVDVNAAQGDGMTALHWAATKGDVELAQMLLYAGANVKASTRLGAFTPLMMASKAGHPAMIAALLKGGAEVDAKTSAGATPLMMAAASGQAEAVRLLLDAGADVNAKDTAMEQTALMVAAALNRVDAMKVLLAQKADIKAATKVVDLAGLTSPDEESFQGQQPAQAQGGPAEAGRGPEAPAAVAPEAQPSGAAAAPQVGPAATPPAQAREVNVGAQPANRADPGRPAPARPSPRPQVAGVDRQFRFNELVSTQGGLTPLLFAARHGHVEAVRILLEAGADVNQVSAGDKTSPLLMAVINGHYDLAKLLLDAGANPNLASDNGVAPLYGVLNVEWAPKAVYPQPRAYTQQKLTHLELLKALLDKGAEPNVRLKKKVWYSGYNFDLSGVDEIGATPFWRAAYASDVDAMRLLVEYGADPRISTTKPAGRPRTGDGGGRENTQDVSGLPAIPVGGPGVPPLQAAAGVGYGEGFAANSHRYAPAGILPAVKYLVEELGVDVNAVDHEGNTALHHAAARGDNETILYLVEKGAEVTKVNREGQTTADMANGPVQRTQPYIETVALLMKLGAKNNNKCVSC